MKNDAAGLDALSGSSRCKLFVEDFANPHCWLLTADNLHQQAAAIYAGRASSSIYTKVDADNIILQQSRGIDRSVFLLGGFALENAIKAFLVYENPQVGLERAVVAQPEITQPDSIAIKVRARSLQDAAHPDTRGF